MKLELTLETALAVGLVLSLVLPVLGRFVAPWWPRLGEALVRLGADVYGAVTTAKAVRAPSNDVEKKDLRLEEPEDGPPSGARKAPPGGPPLMMLALVFVVGCSGTLTDAVKVADSAHLVGESIRPLIQEHCIDAVATAADVAALRRICDPILVTWDTLRTSHAGLLAGILAVQAGVARVMTLTVPVAAVGAAAVDLTESVATLRGAP